MSTAQSRTSSNGPARRYAYQGTTLNGKPYYKNQDNELHIFYDEDCHVSADQWSAWYIGCGAPDPMVQSNLQHGAAGDCCNFGQIRTEELPLGALLCEQAPWERLFRASPEPHVRPCIA